MKTNPKKPTGGELADATCSALERVIAALLTPTVETMRLAGIARLSVERDQTVLLQMHSGEVIGPLKVGDARRTLGTHIAWSAQELGEHNARTLLEMLEPPPNA